MADGLKEVLAKYVPESVLDDAVEAVKTTEVAPEWYRNDIAKIGGEVKEGREAKARLQAIESAPKRKEALQRVGIDYDAVPKYGQKALDAIPVEDLEDLEKVAKFVQAEGFDAKYDPEGAGEVSNSEQVSEFSATAGTGAPPSGGDREALLAKANSIEEINEIVAKYPAPAQ